MFKDMPPEDNSLYYPGVFALGFLAGGFMGVLATNPGHGAYLREVIGCGYIFGVISLCISGRWGCLTGILLMVMANYNIVIPGFDTLSPPSEMGLILQIFFSIIWLRWRRLTLLRVLVAGLFTMLLVLGPTLCDPDPLNPGIGACLTAWTIAFGVFVSAQVAVQVARLTRARRVGSEEGLPGLS